MAATGQIDYVEFPAIDIAKTKKFYSDVFAWMFPYQPQR
jgi:predicted enzyme related to lactoylglutathione lyase